jgi:LysM repeat protein
MTRALFFIGISFLLLACGGLGLLATASLPVAPGAAATVQVAIVVPTPPPPAATSSPTATATPTPPAAVTPAGSVTPGGFYHPVQDGETLAGIARRYGVTPAALCAANELPDCNIIGAGQMLWVPASPATPPPTGTLTPPPEGTTETPASPTPPATPSPTPWPPMRVDVAWPNRMAVDRSDSIRLLLLPSGGPAPAIVIVTPGHTAVAVSVTPPVGTPGVPVAESFGPGYRGYAAAHLVGAAFDVSPLTTESQSLEQPEIVWEWNVLPKKAGPQVVNVDIVVQWRPVGGGGEIIQRQVWRRQLQITVREPLIAKGQLSLLTVVSGFLGSGLSIPWLYEKIAEKRRQRLQDGA